MHFHKGKSLKGNVSDNSSNGKSFWSARTHSGVKITISLDFILKPEIRKLLQKDIRDMSPFT